MNIGDIVKSIPGNAEGHEITKALVTSVFNKQMTIKLLDGATDARKEKGANPAFSVLTEHFEVIGHVMPFNREDALELLEEKESILVYELCEADLRDFPLNGADLTDADLRKANLSRANLVFADLSYATLTGAKLRKADLSLGRLWSAVLREANLRDANLSFSILDEADLRGANLSGAMLCDADLVETDLRNAILNDTDLCGANLCKADLRGASIENTYLLLNENTRGIKLDAQQAAQFAYYLCCVDCEDAGFLNMRNAMLDFANTYQKHERLMPIAPEGVSKA